LSVAVLPRARAAGARPPCCEGCVTVENIIVVAVVLPAPTGRFGSGTQGTDGPILPRKPVW
jgi:hypothetical protein